MALTQVTSAGLLDSTIVGGDISEATISAAKLINNTLTDTQINASAAIALSKLASTGALGSAITATTQSASDNSTKLATTAYVQTAVTNLIGGAPGALDTLNELAAAINDDSSYASTVTTALATKAVLTGSTNNSICTVTGANTFKGNSDLLWNGSRLDIDTGGTEDALRIGNTAGADTAIRLGSIGTDPDTHAVIKYDKDDNYLSLLVSGEAHGAGGILIANGGYVGINTPSPSSHLHVRGSGNDTILLVESTDADANAGPIIELFRSSSSPADNDALGRIDFRGKDDGGNASTFARIAVTALDVTNNTEDARLDFIAATNDTFSPTMSIVGGNVKIGTISDHTVAATKCPLYIRMTTDIVGVGTAEGDANNGLLRLEETGSNANRYHGIELRNRQSGDIRFLNQDRGNSNHGDFVLAMPSAGANLGIHTKMRFDSGTDSIMIAGKGGASLLGTTDTGYGKQKVDLYLSTKTGVTAVNTQAGDEVAGLIRFEDVGSSNSRFHGIEFRNRNSGDVRILNLDEGVSNKSNLVFATDSGSDIEERLRITSAGHLLHGVTSDEDTSGNGGVRFINAGDIQIDGDQKALVFRSTNSTAQVQSGIEWWNENGAGVQAKIICDRTAIQKAPSDIVFFTNTDVDTSANSSEGDVTEHFRITSAGKLHRRSLGTQTNPALSAQHLYENGITTDGNYYLKSASMTAPALVRCVFHDNRGWMILMQHQCVDCDGLYLSHLENKVGTPNHATSDFQGCAQTDGLNMTPMNMWDAFGPNAEDSRMAMYAREIQTSGGSYDETQTYSGYVGNPIFSQVTFKRLFSGNFSNGTFEYSIRVTYGNNSATVYSKKGTTWSAPSLACINNGVVDEDLYFCNGADDGDTNWSFGLMQGGTPYPRLANSANGGGRNSKTRWAIIGICEK